MRTLVLAALAAAAPVMTASPPPYPASVAVISDSGSTNTAGFILAVPRHGRAEVTMAGEPPAHPAVPGTLVAKLYHDLAAAGPLAALPAAACMKSASFGSRLTIAYHGQFSPDVTCSDDRAMRALNADANALVNAAQINVRRLRPRSLPPLRLDETPPTPAPVPVPAAT